MDEVEKLLQELTQAAGASGHEAEVRDIVRRHVGPLGEISYDRLGSLVVHKAGGPAAPKVAIEAHMDEVGFMVSHITTEGFIKFVTLGRWWEHVLLAQRVVIKTGTGDVPGTIGAKPPHFLQGAEASKLVELKDMYIDIGARSREEVEKAGVKVSDPAVAVSPFTVLANGKSYLSKAFDDRGGCGVTITTFKKLAGQELANALYGIFSVQEEVGLRGATTAIEVVNPDVAIVLEGTGASDTPGTAASDEPRFGIGKGPIITFFREDMIPNLKLRELVMETAKQNKIPVQARVGGIAGRTNGAVIHLHRTGIPTIVISLPARHIHCHTSIIHRDDFDNTVALLTKLIPRLDKKTVAGLVKW